MLYNFRRQYHDYFLRNSRNLFLQRSSLFLLNIKILKPPIPSDITGCHMWLLALHAAPISNRSAVASNNRCQRTVGSHRSFTSFGTVFKKNFLRLSAQSNSLDSTAIPSRNTAIPPGPGTVPISGEIIIKNRPNTNERMRLSDFGNFFHQVCNLFWNFITVISVYRVSVSFAIE